MRATGNKPTHFVEFFDLLTSKILLIDINSIQTIRSIRAFQWNKCVTVILFDLLQNRMYDASQPSDSEVNMYFKKKIYFGFIFSVWRKKTINFCFETVFQVSLTDINDIGDIIILGESSDFETKFKWKFPTTSKCPCKSCGISCSSRNVAIAHFRSAHAKTSVLCTLCDRLFDDSVHLLLHYDVEHPDTEPPTLKEVCIIHICVVFIL